jgi:hypothetical protein
MSFVRHGSLSLGISFLSPDTRVLTVLLTTRQGETCDTLGEKLAANQTAILLMNPGISCKFP